MKLKTLMAAACAAIALGGFAAANDYYVDANNGNDLWDGSTPVIPSAEVQAAGGTIPGPKKTLEKVMTDCKPLSGDTVHAAAGVYNEGSMDKWCRVNVPEGVTLIGDEGAEKTIILGKAHDGGTQGCGETALRCVYLNSNAKVRQFTLTGGHTLAYVSTQASGYWGGAAEGIGLATCYVYDCIITNNVSGRGACNGLTGVRCRFSGNLGNTSTPDMIFCAAYGCVFGACSGSNCYQAGPFVNCTFYGSGTAVSGVNGNNPVLSNCLVLKDLGSYLTIHRTYYTGSVGSSQVVLDDGSEKVTTAELKLDANYRPAHGSSVINKGNNSYYTDAASSYDIIGQPRILEDVIDIGAYEVSSVQTDWYVDAENGNDETGDGTTPETAWKTLAAAIEGMQANPLFSSDDILHAAPGTYKDGVMTAPSVTTTGVTDNFRVIVPKGLTLLADQGPDKTFIVGAPDLTTTPAPANHFGPNAVSCVKLRSGAIIRGFVLTGGYVRGNDAGKDWGAAVHAGTATGSSFYDAYVVDCVVTNNYAIRGAGLWGATAIRCRFNDNWVSTTGVDIMQGRSFNCLFGDMQNSGGDRCNVYQGGVHVNATFYGNGVATRTSDNVRNSIVLKPSAGSGILYKCCALGGTGDTYKGDADSKHFTLEEMLLDENYRPRRGSPVLNIGKESYYDDFPAALSDEKLKDLLGENRIQNGRIDVGCYEVDATPLQVHVDAEAGDDDEGDGSAEKPYRTLAKAGADGRLDVKDEIVAAPGVYSNGVVTVPSVIKGGIDDSFRIVLPAGVKLVSSEGPEKTFIIGAPDTETGTAATRYCGPKAVSCVKLNANTLIRGFTLTGGHTRGYDGNHWGGAVHSGKGALDPVMNAYVVDCIVTNNYAARGAIWGATSVGCRFEGNYASQTAADIMQGAAYNCSFGNYVAGSENVYMQGPYVNCTFHGIGKATHIVTDKTTPPFEGVRNCILLKMVENCVLHNCLTDPGKNSNTELDADCQPMTAAEMKLDANGVPIFGSPALDNAKAADWYADFAAAHPDLAAEDVCGNPRVSNALMDLGATEFDYRPVYAKTLKPSKLKVTSADANVTLGEKCVNIPEGDGLALEWTLRNDTDCTFKVAVEGEGTVTVTVDGEILAPVAAGAYKFAGTAGVHAIGITFAGEGAAVASEFRTNEGLAILLR